MWTESPSMVQRVSEGIFMQTLDKCGIVSMISTQKNKIYSGHIRTSGYSFV